MKRKLFIGSLLALSIFACKKNEENVVPVEQFSENKHVKLLLTDAENSNLYLVNGKDYSIESFTDFPHNGARAYSTTSGRYAGVVSGSGNFVKFFDSGIEVNGNVVTESTPKWAKTVANGTSPVHFYSNGNNTVIFNDGDGSLSLFKEDELHTKATAVNLPSGNTKHHGAPVIFNNGKIAITHKATVDPVAGVLPEYVKVVDMAGTEVHAVDIKTGGIHGEASDGVTAIFGSTSGILKVKDDGKQSLISFPTSFGTTWLGSYFYGKESNVFVGFRRGFGVYKVDVNANTVTTIDNSTDFNAVTFDEKGKYLIILHKTGKLKIVDPVTGNTITETTSTVGFPASGTAFMPIIKASAKVVYVVDAVNKKLLTYKKSDLSLVKEIALPGKALTATIIGYDAE
jgi:hypothetical protein